MSGPAKISYGISGLFHPYIRSVAKEKGFSKVDFRQAIRIGLRAPKPGTAEGKTTPPLNCLTRRDKSLIRLAGAEHLRVKKRTDLTDKPSLKAVIAGGYSIDEKPLITGFKIETIDFYFAAPLPVKGK